MQNPAALITGCTKRIGRELALYLAKSGYDIIISYNSSQSDAENLKKEIREKFSVNCEYFKCDLTKASEAEDLANFAAENFPNWNLLVNNASIFQKSRFLNEGDVDLLSNLNIHLISPLILSKKFAKICIEKKTKDAQIINMIDKSVSHYKTSYFYYLLTKKFLLEFTKMLAVEIAPDVRVNAIALGFILNSIDEKDAKAETENLVKKIPLRRKGDVENVVQTFEFLLANKFITGQTIFVDGGDSL